MNESALTISRPLLISHGTILTIFFIASDILSLVALKYSQYLVFNITIILLNLIATIVFLITTLILIYQEYKYRYNIRNSSLSIPNPDISSEEWTEDWL